MRSLLLKISRSLFRWPPEPSSPETKHALVARFAGSAPNLVETGTFEGDMVEAQREKYSRIVSIELADALCSAARKRFEPYPHITILHGDSGQVLPDALRLLKGPAAFWLDGHYSGGVTAGGNSEPPILRELAMIAARGEPRDAILIDDARLFGWRRGYPSLTTLREFAVRNWPHHKFQVESDVICIVPKQSSRSA